MKLFTYIKNMKGDKGFTLIEGLVAISILSVSVTAPLLIAQKGVSSAMYARDQVTAFYLAQEAVEYIRNIRDTNRITGAPSWLDTLTPCMSTGAGEKCTIDARYSDPFTSPGAILSCPSGNCPTLLFDPAEGIYGYGTGWQPTIFTRSISVSNLASPKEAEIAVTISWTTKLFLPVRTFTIREHIFNY